MLIQGIIEVGAGTKQSSPSNGSTVAVVPHAATLAGDLVLCLCYLRGGDARLARDGGDGWVLLDSLYNATADYGIFLALCVASLTGLAPWAGFLMQRSGYVSQCYTLRLPPAYKWSVPRARGSIAATQNATAGNTLTCPTALPSYSQAIEVIAGGEGDAGNAGSHTMPTGYTTLFDTAQASPTYSLTMGYRVLDSAPALTPVVISCSGSYINRGCARGTVPILTRLPRHLALTKGKP